MSSWLSLSLPNLLFKGYDNDDEEEGDHPQQIPPPPSVKHADFSAAIGRQLRGVAAFLAPPPTTSGAGPSASGGTSSETLLGIKNDLVEIGSLLSSNKAVTKISRFASNLLQFGDAKDEKLEGEGLGINNEVVEFVRNISTRPQLWTDFPLALGNDFDRSDIQREHTAAIEDMVPGITALRHEICNYLQEEQFWMIYFILLLSRLAENDAKLLSTPEIVEARDVLLQKLQNKNMVPMGDSEVFKSVNTSINMVTDSSSQTNKRVSRETEDLAKVFNAGLKINYCETTSRSEDKAVSTYTSIDEIKQCDEDTSFSDLEIDDDYLPCKQPVFRQADIKSVPSGGKSSGWVEVNENFVILGDKQKSAQSTSREKGSESEESNEWETIDDSDLDRPATG